MCQGFSHFPGFLYHFVMAKSATSSIMGNASQLSRVNCSGSVLTVSESGRTSILFSSGSRAARNISAAVFSSCSISRKRFGPEKDETKTLITHRCQTNSKIYL